MKVVAACFGAVAVEVDADRSTPRAPRARLPMAIRREVGLLDGRGRHGRVSTTDDSRAGSEASEDGPSGPRR